MGKRPGGSYAITAARPVKPTASSAAVQKGQPRRPGKDDVCDVVADDLFTVDDVGWFHALILIVPRVLFGSLLTRLLICS